MIEVSNSSFSLDGVVGVVEAQQELAVVSLGVVVVQHGRLHVADVHVAGCLGREARHHLAVLGEGQLGHGLGRAVQADLALLRLDRLGGGLARRLTQTAAHTADRLLHGRNGGDVVEPARRVGELLGNRDVEH